MRVVLDSALRIPDHARVLDEDAPTVVLTTERSSPTRRAALRARGVAVEVVADRDGRVDLAAGASCLRSLGIELLLVEGGAQVITGLLRAHLVDRLVVAIAPLIIGTGTSAVGQLDVARVADGIRLINRTVTPIGADVLLAWDVDGAPPERPA